ncbi:hypothetical protein [Arthrobacter sp. H14-L1]|uniref:hypothetical protein n=1 Tax=Arthrobacter sp. H14-L1 TaxID=2996697 RepID=UPI0022715CEB|nr:hypothetical protein [Arthrobacter sp. H14-L1]MCY0903859.1 hypothetical protein [Arthrobacter sp. H14-L1]
MPNFQIEQVTGFSAPTVLKWRHRYAEGGIEAPSHVQHPGRVREIDEIAVIADTLTNDGNPSAELGISHWSAASWPHATESFPPVGGGGTVHVTAGKGGRGEYR